MVDRPGGFLEAGRAVLSNTQQAVGQPGAPPGNRFRDVSTILDQLFLHFGNQELLAT